MNKAEKIVIKFMKEVKPFTYKENNDGRLMTDLCNFHSWLKTESNDN